MSAVAELSDAVVKPRKASRNAVARDSLQLTSLSDREIVIRLLGEAAWQLLDGCAPSGAPAARRACCTRCWATSGWSSAIPFLQDDLLDNPKRRAQLIEALHHRLREVEKRRATTGRCGDAAPRCVQLLRGCARQRGRRRFERRIRRDLRPAQARAGVLGPAHAQRTTSTSTACARVSHVTDATDWRVE